MNRRDFAARAAGLLLVPSWLANRPAPAGRSVNLDPFCWDASTKYDLAKPFVQERRDGRLDRYATDGRIAVRVPTDESGKGTAAKLPDVAGLPWREDRDRWLPWPAKPTPIIADGAECLDCDATGVAGKAVECEKCEGFGCEYEFDDDEPDRFGPKDCERCQGTGCTGPRCPTCQGKGRGRFPHSIELMPGVWVAWRYHAIMRRELDGIEFGPKTPPIDGKACAIPFRFDGGGGLLMPLLRPTP